MSKWPSAPLAEIARFKSGGTPSKSNPAYWEGSIPWLSAKDLKSFWLDDSEDHITEQALEDGARLVSAGAVLILIRGMTLLKEVPVGVTRRPVAFNQDVKGLLVDEKRILPEFLAYFLLKQNHILLGLVTQAGHGTGRLSADALAELEVSLPPLPEQRKIASALGAWEQTIQKLDAARFAKTKRLAALRQQLLSGKRRFPKFGRTKWRHIQLSEILKHIFRPVNWSPKEMFRLISIRRRCGGLFRREDLLGADYKTTDLHEIRAGDFLVSKRQVVHGAWAMVTKEFSGCHVSKEYSILANKAPDVLYMPFFDWLSHEQRMWHLAFLASDGVHREKLIFDSKDFLRHYIELPPTIEEQERIVQVLDACGREIRLLESELEALRQQKRGLMQKLLNGEIPVKT
jgi:type I restriction enzyme S subunit